MQKFDAHLESLNDREILQLIGVLSAAMAGIAKDRKMTELVPLCEKIHGLATASLTRDAVAKGKSEAA